MHVTEVISVVNSIDTAFTALLSSILAPEILTTVGPSFPTTFKRKPEFTVNIDFNTLFPRASIQTKIEREFLT